MTIKLKLLPASTMKAKAVTNIAGQVEAGAGITVVKAGGDFTVSLDTSATASLYQPLDAGLTALAANSTNGFWAAGADVARTLTGTANEITVTGGDGSGVPTFSLPPTLTLTGKTITRGTYDSPTWTGTPTALDDSGTASAGPSVSLIRLSPTPAANDLIGFVQYYGTNSLVAAFEYARTQGKILDPTAASEDGQWSAQTAVAGTLADRLIIVQGAQIGSPTGGDKGAGTLNAAGSIYVNNVATPTVSSTDELTNKTLNASVGKGTWTASGTWTLPALTLGGTISGGGSQINNVIIGTTTPLAGSFTTLVATSINGVTIDNTAWTTYTPTITASSGTFTSVSAVGRYQILGKTMHVSVRVVITTVGSASGQVNVPLPSGTAKANQAVYGYVETTGFGVTGVIVGGASTLIGVLSAAGGSIIAGGTTFIIQATIELT